MKNLGQWRFWVDLLGSGSIQKTVDTLKILTTNYTNYKISISEELCRWSSFYETINLLFSEMKES